MKCLLCGTGDAACGPTHTGTPVDIPARATNMTDQGPLLRVDTDGRGTLLKLTRRQADDYVSSHPGASIVGRRPPASEVESPFVEQGAETKAGPDLAAMRKPDLVKLAEERGLDSSGTADDLRARLTAEPEPDDEDEEPE